MKNEDKKTTSRASQTRAKTLRKKVWTPPSYLDTPNAPTGFRHRWVRVEILGYVDTKNIQGRLRSGYELVRADEFPGEAVQKIKKSSIKKLVITDSIDNIIKVKRAQNIEVLTVSNLMGEAIKRISNSTSVSDLFK